MSRPVIRESLVLSSCIKWLWAHKCYVWRNNTGGFKDAKGQYVRFGLTGSSDIVGMTPRGRFIAVECKSSVGKLSDPQKAFAEKVIAHNGIYIVARSVDDLEAVKHVILS